MANPGALNPATQVTMVINGVTCAFWDEGRSEVFAYAGSSTQKAEWRIRCFWSDRLNIARALMGGSTPVGGTTIFVSGWQYPDNPVWYVQNVQTTGDGLLGLDPTTGMVTYERAALVITFGIPDFNFGSSSQIGEDEVDFACETVPILGSTASLKYNDGTKVPSQQMPVVEIGVVTFVRSRYNLAVLPEAVILNAIDYVNSTPIFGAPAGTVLFKGARSRRKITASGALNWDVTYTFVIRRVPWNQIYRPGVGFQNVQYIGTGPDQTTSAYIPSYDLNLLFQ
jgi:hypothetical protein